MAEFKPSPELYPFRSRWLETPAGRLHYVDEGDGRPLLLLHGNPTWSFLYREVIGRLREGFRCIAPDLIGFGLSERPPLFGYTPAEHAAVIGTLVRELDLRELIVLGHDWGGPIGLATAVEMPDRVGGLALGNTWYWAPEAPQRAFSLAMSSPPMQWAIRERNFFVERIVPSGTARRLSPEEMRHYRAVQPTPDARAGVAELPRQIVAAGPWLGRLEQRVGPVLGSKPLLVTWPMADFAFPARMIGRLRRPFGDVTVVEVEGARHYLAEDAPGELAQAVRDRFG